MNHLINWLGVVVFAVLRFVFGVDFWLAILVGTGTTIIVTFLAGAAADGRDGEEAGESDAERSV